MRVVISTIPYSQMRYPSVGDYTVDQDGTLNITVADMGNDDYTALIAVHELIEAVLCKKRGIELAHIDAFDIDFEAQRQPGDISEPGDDPQSPYQNEHCLATAAERMLAAALGVKWADYEGACQCAS